MALTRTHAHSKKVRCTQPLHSSTATQQQQQQHTAQEQKKKGDTKPNGTKGPRNHCHLSSWMMTSSFQVQKPLQICMTLTWCKKGAPYGMQGRMKETRYIRWICRHRHPKEHTICMGLAFDWRRKRFILLHMTDTCLLPAFLLAWCLLGALLVLSWSFCHTELGK